MRLGIEYDLIETREDEDGEISLYGSWTTIDDQKVDRLPYIVTIQERPDGSMFGKWAATLPEGHYLKEIDAKDEDAFFDTVIRYTEDALIYNRLP